MRVRTKKRFIAPTLSVALLSALVISSPLQFLSTDCGCVAGASVFIQSGDCCCKENKHFTFCGKKECCCKDESTRCNCVDCKCGTAEIPQPGIPAPINHRQTEQVFIGFVDFCFGFEFQHDCSKSNSSEKPSFNHSCLTAQQMCVYFSRFNC